MAYVYKHIRKDTEEPFYIGIGSDSKYYRAYKFEGRNEIWCRIKSKTEGSKKEKIVYDIDLLMQELIKINSIKDTITLEDIEDSFFKVDADIFDFIENLMSGDFETSLSKSEKS